MTTKFRYRRLHRNPPEIRLLNLHPAVDPSLPLSCTVQHIALTTARYHCLSYVWGDPNHDHTSEIYMAYAQPTLGERLSLKAPRQCRVEIGSSLDAALRHLRNDREQITVWADALCINQGDDKEKNWQIKLMKQIYSNATMVHAWLGPRYDEHQEVVDSIAAAFDLALHVANMLKRLDCISRLEDEASWSKACFSLANPRGNLQQKDEDQVFWTNMIGTLYETLASEGLWHRYLVAFQTLSQAEYFRRIWILQETGRARSLTFHYGEDTAPYKLLFFSLCLARPFCKPSGFDSRFLTCLTARMNCSLNCGMPEVLELAYWHRPPVHQATNPRDLVYALLGLASDPMAIDARYDRNVEYAYVSATRLLLSRGFTDILISFKPYTSSQVVDPGTFPSWAFDWSTRGIPWRGKYKACGDTKAAISFETLPGLRGKEVMVLRGRTLGHVTATSHAFSAVAAAAGLDQQVINTGTITLQPASTEGALTFGEQIRREHEQLGIKPLATDNERLLFDQAPLSIPPIWLWWVKWVSELWNLATSRPGQQNNGEALRDVVELSSRHDPGSLNEVFAKATSLNDLINVQFWVKTTHRSISARQDGQTTVEAEAAAWPSVDVLQSLFSSAWGMRPLSLSEGHLGYGPESAQKLDKVVIFDGVTVPLVVRKVNETAYKILGPAYVCGTMQGQCIDGSSPGRRYMVT